MAVSSRPRWLRPALFAAAALCAASAVRCSSATIDPNAHTWGSFNTCLRRLSDECRAQDADGGCRTEAVDQRTLQLGVRSDGTFLWGRDGLPAMEGRQQGERFEIVRREPLVATICGCGADVTETIRGEFSEARVEQFPCEAPDGGQGCGRELPAMLFDAGFPAEGWLAGAADAGVELGRAYASFRAVVVDEAVAVSLDGGSCPCLPCRVVFEVAGRK